MDWLACTHADTPVLRANQLQTNRQTTANKLQANRQPIANQSPIKQDGKSILPGAFAQSSFVEPGWLTPKIATSYGLLVWPFVGPCGLSSGSEGISLMCTTDRVSRYRCKTGT